MSDKPAGWRGRFVLGALIPLMGLPTAAPAQIHSTEALHATLRGWEDDVRVTIFDRSGAYHGRLSDRGILQRFHELMDQEYSIDLWSSDFSLSEDYAWYTQRRGARWWGGSIDRRSLAQRAEIAGAVSLGETWSFDLILTQEASLRARRVAFRATLQKSFWDGGVLGFVTGWLQADKPDIDLELGLQLKPGNNDITVAFGALDLASDLIYQRLGVRPDRAPQRLDYTQHPFTTRVAIDVPIASQFRAELYGLVMFPSHVRVISQTATDSSFAQGERYAYAGGLLEWAPTPQTAVGAFGTWVGAELDRVTLDQGPSTDDFRLTEQTGQIGVYGMHRIVSRLVAEVRLGHEWRVENRRRPDPTVAPTTDYEDRSLIGRATMTYRAKTGFRAGLGFDFLGRNVIGTDSVPGAFQEANNTRVRFDIGWHINHSAMFVLGVNADLDGDGGATHTRFDGAHVRFQLFW